jgi:hypothetical protein
MDSKRKRKLQCVQCEYGNRFSPIANEARGLMPGSDRHRLKQSARRALRQFDFLRKVS